MKQAKTFIVSGKVQGVGFRYLAQAAALEKEVTGWVKNLDNGFVEIYAEGTAEQLNSFVSVLKQGSRFARVHHIKEEPAAIQQLTTFKIKY